MARRYRKKKSHGRAKPSLISMVPIAVVGKVLYDGYQAGGMSEAANRGVLATTAYNMNAGKIQVEYATPFYGMLVATYAAKKLVAFTGVNKHMKGLPFRL